MSSYGLLDPHKYHSRRLIREQSTIDEMMKDMQDYTKSIFSRVQGKHGIVTEQIPLSKQLRRMKLKRGKQLEEDQSDSSM